MRRIRTALNLRAQMFRHRGTAVVCPLCGSSFASFKPDRGRPNALCWRCGSHERHRAQWLLFQQRPALLAGASSLLHFAPEYCLSRKLATLPDLRYVTADLDPAGVDLALDVTALDLPDGAFDAVICSHVLEHVPDDAAAMAELRRVVAPGGFCLIMVPVALERERTYEDATVVTPQDRAREFLQFDHVRLYSPDIAERLRTAGFDVETVDLSAELGPLLGRRHGLLASDLVFLCRR